MALYQHPACTLQGGWPDGVVSLSEGVGRQWHYQHPAHCSTLKHTETHYNSTSTLQHIIAHWNTLQLTILEVWRGGVRVKCACVSAKVAAGWARARTSSLSPKYERTASPTHDSKNPKHDNQGFEQQCTQYTAWSRHRMSRARVLVCVCLCLFICVCAWMCSYTI